MKVNGVSGRGTGLYVPINERIENFLIGRIARAKRKGEDYVELILRDQPATFKALETIKSRFSVDYTVQRSDSLKVTIPLK